MRTDLFAAVAGLAPGDVEAVVPPACRRGVEFAPPPVVEGEDLVVTLPPWRPRPRARHLLPSFGTLGAGVDGFRLEVSVETPPGWSPWIAGASVGRVPFAPVPDRVESLAAAVDVFLAERPVDRVRLRLRVRNGARALAAPWLMALSACEPGPALGEAEGRAAEFEATVALEVPALSQMDAPEAVARRICSPTAVAMVLGYWGERVDPVVLAGEIFQPALDLYGVWPAAIAAAARHGVLGYLLRFPDWSSALWCLRQGLPIVASIRYDAGELHGAAVPATAGHLAVLAGVDGGEVLVNDPAAPTREGVARRYRRDEFGRVWLERSGVGYVLFRPGSRSRAGG